MKTCSQNKWRIVCVSALLLAFSAWATADDLPVRRSTGAGKWFEASPEALREQITGFMAKASKEELPGKAIALISPHAGYVYSGKAAAYCFRQLKADDYDRVIILGPSHYSGHHGVVIAPWSAYETPLGRVPLDREVCDALLKKPLFSDAPSADTQEHSLENLVPFLQVSLNKFKIVPCIVGRMNSEDYDIVAEALRAYVNERTLVAVSSDFTHYGADYDYVPFKTDVKENMRKLDGEAAELITKPDFDGFQKFLARTNATICGQRAIGIMLKLLPKEARGKLLTYTTSADSAGDLTRVVGYAPIIFWKGSSSAQTMTKEEHAATLQTEEKRTLLKLARQTLGDFYAENGDRVYEFRRGGFFQGDPLTAFVDAQSRKWAKSNENLLTERLKEKKGAFVTIEKEGQLRGCIGHIEGIEPLYCTVMENALNAAVRDPRFNPMSRDELGKVQLEISVMTPLRLLSDPMNEVQVGRDGLVVQLGSMRGLLLPQVATEYNWDTKTFLEQTCHKANLDKNAWLNGAQVYAFSAQVFGEGDGL